MSILNDGHWETEYYKQRMSTKDWKKLLLDCDDHITYNGIIRQLRAKNLGYGVVEVSKTPLSEDK